MICSDVRLEEYLDGELDAPGIAAVEAHLADCPDCRERLAELRRLEELLSTASPVSSPEPGRFVLEVRKRAHRPRYAWAAAAAIAVAAIALFGFPSESVDVRFELARYAENPDPEIAERIASTGKSGIRELQAALDDSEVRIQFAAAALLFQIGGEPMRERLLARYEARDESDAGWVLADIGAEKEDAEIAPIAVSLALEGQEVWALDVLRRLNRMHREAQEKVVDAVVSLLKSDNPKVQSLALEIIRELDVEFSLSAVVDLLDSPDLGDEARRFLREQTGEDHGKDKDAWRRAIEQKEER